MVRPRNVGGCSSGVPRRKRRQWHGQNIGGAAWPAQTTNNNNNKHDNVYGAVIMAEPLREFTRFI